MVLQIHASILLFSFSRKDVSSLRIFLPNSPNFSCVGTLSPVIFLYHSIFFKILTVKNSRKRAKGDRTQFLWPPLPTLVSPPPPPKTSALSPFGLFFVVDTLTHLGPDTPLCGWLPCFRSWCMQLIFNFSRPRPFLMHANWNESWMYMLMQKLNHGTVKHEIFFSCGNWSQFVRPKHHISYSASTYFLSDDATHKKYSHFRWLYSTSFQRGAQNFKMILIPLIFAFSYTEFGLYTIRSWVISPPRVWIPCPPLTPHNLLTIALPLPPRQVGSRDAGVTPAGWPDSLASGRARISTIHPMIKSFWDFFNI